MAAARNNGSKTVARRSDGRFAPGNPGRPKGSRHKITLAVERLLDGQAKALTQKAIDLALGGDMQALRLCLERLLPPRKDRTVEIALPAISDAEDHPRALAAVLAAVAAGQLTPAEAQQFGAVLEMHRKALETADLEARIRALEQRTDSP
ncbi:MAG: hypothetical protein GC201_16345 [Alphaproteobacteria bacterium]|nr:hypothetical protein [Alphaproteobacteria bacterium]